MHLWPQASSMPLAVGRASLALSPDGTHLVYVALANGDTRLHVRDMARGDFAAFPALRAHIPSSLQTASGSGSSLTIN